MAHTLALCSGLLGPFTLPPVDSRGILGCLPSAPQIKPLLEPQVLAPESCLVVWRLSEGSEISTGNQRNSMGGQLLLGLEGRVGAPYVTLLGLDHMSRFKGVLGQMVKAGR